MVAGVAVPSSRDQERRGRNALARALLAGAALLAALVGCGGEAPLTGTDLGKRPAPDFALTDQRGQTVRLSDLRGKAVALTFVYTHCPDVCPLTVENLRAAHELLPEGARDEVALVAVTLDPERDTLAARQDFSARHRLAGNPSWYALGGDRVTLERIWRDYGIYPGEHPAARVPHHAASPGATPSDAIALPSAYTLSHTDATYLIDPEGRERVLLRADVGPTVLAENLERLVA